MSVSRKNISSGHFNLAICRDIPYSDRRPMNDDPAPSRLISHLAAVCADARGDLYDTLDVQVAFKREHRPRSVKTIERFEEGNTWPNDPQATVDAYADLTGIPSWELWQMAINQWKAAQAEDDDQNLPVPAHPPKAPQLGGQGKSAKDRRQAES